MSDNSKKSILLNTSQGLGNVVNCSYAIVAIKSLGYDIDLLYTSDGITPKYVANIINDSEYIRNIYVNKEDIKSEYDKYGAFFGPDELGGILKEDQSFIKVGKANPLVTKFSEAILNMGVAWKLGYPKGKIPKGYFNAVYIDEDFSDSIVICPGSKTNLFGKRKKYMSYDKVAEDHDNVMFIGSQTDYDYHRELQQYKWFIGKDIEGLLTAAYITSQAGLFISNDTGFMHVRAVTRLPQVAVFGPSMIAKNLPFSEHSRIVCLNSLECLPCQKTGKWKYCENECMDFSHELINEEIERWRKHK